MHLISINSLDYILPLFCKYYKEEYNNMSNEDLYFWGLVAAVIALIALPKANLFKRFFGIFKK